jgi:D-alanine-D-alanine ligase
MRVGLTYDLRDEYLAAGYDELATAEFDRSETIDAIEDALWSLGHETDRIGQGRTLVHRLACGDRWDLVFNVCEGMHGTAREAQVPAVLDLFDIPYTFSDPLVMALCLHKGLTKVAVRNAGVATPDFVVIEKPADIDAVALAFPLFAKPIAEGTSKGVSPDSKIENRVQLRRVCESLLERFRQPVLVERFLPGREFTVGILGTGADAEVLGSLEIFLRPDAEPNAYSFVNKERCEELIEYRLVHGRDDTSVRRAEESALVTWRALACRDAGRVDLRCDEHGNPCFLEVNPLPGLHPSHSDLPMLCTEIGIEYVGLIDRVVRSAATRAALERPRMLHATLTSSLLE